MIKTIKIFLASSSELLDDRKEFELAINRKNKTLIKKEIFLELVIWEDFLDTVSITRSQDEYNKAIKECDIFVLLFFTKVGKYSAEEFSVALDSFKVKGRPLILTYFKDADIRAGSLNSKDTISLLTFKDQLTAMEHFPSSYENIEGLLLHFSQQYEKIYEAHLKEDTSKIIEEESVPEEEISSPKTKSKRGISHTTISYFTERVNELKEFKEAYQKYNFLAISGTGGIGKTQFTARCVEACNIPKEKTVWFECEPATTLDTVINHAGYPEILKGESKRDKEKVLAFIDKINEHQLILFLEDYHYVQKPFLLADLLKECGTRLKTGKIIVISRNNMVDSSIQPKQILLRGFKDDNELHNYLSNLKDFFKIENKCTDEDLLELFKKLEGHPFAISLACILIQNEVPISEIIEEILHEGENSNSERLLNAIFKRDDATIEEKKFIKNFSAFRGKVNEEDIKTIFSKNEIRTARKLHNKNLLVFENQQLSLHPLVREFCYKRLEHKTDIHKKISTYYITQREDLLETELEDRIFYHLAGGQEYDKIIKTIETLGRKFIQQGFTDVLENMIKILEANFIELPDVSNIFYGNTLERKGEWEKALTFYEKATHSPINKVRIKSLLSMGELYILKSEIKKAQAIFEKVLSEVDKKEFFLKEKADTIIGLGLINNYLGDKALAKEQFEESLTIQKKILDNEGLAKSLNNIGNIYADLKNTKEALKYFYESLKVEEKIGNRDGIATCYNNIGLTKHEASYEQVALEFYNKSLKILEEIGSKAGISISYNNIGGVYDDLGKTEKALKLYEQSLEISKEIGDLIGCANCYTNIGCLKLNKGNYEEGLKLIKEGLRIWEEIGNKDGIANTLFNLGEFYFEKNKLELACESLFKSYAIYKQMNLPDQNKVKMSLIDLRKQNKSTFKEVAKKSYESLPKELKEEIDIVEIIGQPVKVEKQPGRNDLCHCGSGKKYKKCHGK